MPLIPRIISLYVSFNKALNKNDRNPFKTPKKQGSNTGVCKKHPY